MSKFDYIKYDSNSCRTQDLVKQRCMQLEELLDDRLSYSPDLAMALQKLQEFYFWVGQSIKSDQNFRGVPREFLPRREDGGEGSSPT